MSDEIVRKSDEEILKPSFSSIGQITLFVKLYLNLIDVLSWSKIGSQVFSSWNYLQLCDLYTSLSDLALFILSFRLPLRGYPLLQIFVLTSPTFLKLPTPYTDNILTSFPQNFPPTYSATPMAPNQEQKQDMPTQSKALSPLTAYETQPPFSQLNFKPSTPVFLTSPSSPHPPLQILTSKRLTIITQSHARLLLIQSCSSTHPHTSSHSIILFNNGFLPLNSGPYQPSRPRYGLYYRQRIPTIT